METNKQTADSLISLDMVAMILADLNKEMRYQASEDNHVPDGNNDKIGIFLLEKQF